MKTKPKNWLVTGIVNGIKIDKYFENEYSADSCAKTLNEVFAPFTVEEIIREIEPGDIVPAPRSSEGAPF